MKITVHMGTCGIAAGAREVMNALLEELGAVDRQDIRVVTSGCMGMCSSEPNVTVETREQSLSSISTWTRTGCARCSSAMCCWGRCRRISPWREEENSVTAHPGSGGRRQCRNEEISGCHIPNHLLLCGGTGCQCVGEPGGPGDAGAGTGTEGLSKRSWWWKRDATVFALRDRSWSSSPRTFSTRN